MSDQGQGDDHPSLAPWAGRMWWIVTGLFVLTMLGFLAVGADEPADPVLGPPVGLAGFGTITFGVDDAPVRCALLADTPAQQQQGMRDQQHFGGRDGMVFRVAADSTAVFDMRRVPIPLSIAWFDGRGRLLATADMDPCPDQEGCPTYSAGKPFRVALEVPRGELARLGVGPDAVLSLGGPCP